MNPYSESGILEGSPAQGGIALLLIDVINEMDFPEAANMLPAAFAMAREIAGLKAAASRAGIPAIYVNDNFGHWRSDFNRQVHHCLQRGGGACDIARLLAPAENDYSVLKPKHSGFFLTPLELLLKSLEVHTLILTGIAGNICVHYTANDAYMRDFHLIVPCDCVVSNSPAENRAALSHMQRLLKADVRPWRELNISGGGLPSSHGPPQRAVPGSLA